MSADETPVDPRNDLMNWISLSEAAARLPSPRAGKRTHPSTVYRLAKKHDLEVRRRGCYRFVYWPDLFAALMPVEAAAVRQPRPARQAGSARRTLAQMERTQRILRENGVI